MKTTLLVASGLVLASTTSGLAAVLQHESFETYDLGGKYYDTLDVDTDHMLINNVGEAVVDGDTWDSWYYTTGGVGLGDGDWLGVTAYAGSTGGFTHGDQAFQWTDTDGGIEMIFAGVAGATAVTMDIFILGGGYETDPLDYLTIGGDGWSGGRSLSGDDLEGYGYWMTLTLIDSAVGSDLTLAMDFNAGTEGLYIDNMVWYDQIPAPGAVALFGLAGLATRRRRRH